MITSNWKLHMVLDPRLLNASVWTQAIYVGLISMGMTVAMQREMKMTLPADEARGRGFPAGRGVRELMTSPRAVPALGIGCAFYVALRTALLQTPELFGLGAEIGGALNDIAIGLLSACFFQYLVVVLPGRRRDEQIAVILAPQLRTIVQTARNLQRALEEASNTPENRFPAAVAQIESMCEGISMDAPSGFLRWQPNDPQPHSLTWKEYFRQISSLSRGRHGELAALYSFVSSDVVAALQGERRARFHNHIGLFNAERIGDTVLTWAAEEIAEYLSACANVEHVLDTLPGRIA
jgi:hypothetical protein